MNRRPVLIIVALLSVALLVSFGGLVTLYLAVGREPAVPSRAALSLEIGGDIVETRASDVVTYLSDARTPTDSDTSSSGSAPGRLNATAAGASS